MVSKLDPVVVDIEDDEDDIENESREDKFRRIVTRRVNRILGDLAMIEQMAGSSNYKYTRDEVDVMLGALVTAVERTQHRYIMTLTKLKPSSARHSFAFPGKD